MTRPRANSAPPIARMPSPPAYTPPALPMRVQPQRHILVDPYLEMDSYEPGAGRSITEECAEVCVPMSCGVLPLIGGWLCSVFCR